MVFKLYKLYETQRSILHIHVSLLFKSSLYATSFLRKIFISSCFCLLKEIWRGFSFLYGGREERENSVQCLFFSHYRGSVHFEQRECCRLAPSPGTTLSISASSRHSFDLSLWAPVLYLDLFCASLSKMCLKVVASLLYVILARQRFHRLALLSDSGGNW